MSPVTPRASATVGSFPRVSGDEPEFGDLLGTVEEVFPA